MASFDMKAMGSNMDEYNATYGDLQSPSAATLRAELQASRERIEKAYPPQPTWGQALAGPNAGYYYHPYPGLQQAPWIEALRDSEERIKRAQKEQSEALKKGYKLTPDQLPKTSQPVSTGVISTGTLRTFESGATRDSDVNKPDYEGFISPLVTKRYGQYMHKHRVQVDGSLRASNNWQKGIEKEAYLKSLIRHVEDVRLHMDGFPEDAVDADLEEVLCAVIFNASGLIFEMLMDKKGKRGEAA